MEYSIGDIFTGTYSPEVSIWCNQNGYKIQEIEVSENGERQFEIVEDVKPALAVIDELKEVLKASDYKVMKCYEASMVGETLPYDIQTLHSERQNIRNQINEIEART